MDSNIKNTNPAHADIVIVGAGIAGYEAFRALNKGLKKNHINKKILIIDQNNFFTFVPLLHEVAAGSVEPTHASAPIRELLYKTGHSFAQATMKKINPEIKQIETSIGAITYDICIVAIGSTTNYLNTPGAKENTYHVRALRDALILQSAVLSKLESCDRCPLQLTIVGAGYTGVELAAEFAQMAQHDFHKLYPNGKINISIIEPSHTILPQLPKKVQQKISKRLRSMGVDIILNDSVKEVTKDTLKLSSGKTIANDVTIWATGFTTDAICFLPEQFVERGRICVNNFLQTAQFSNIYAIGDIAKITDPKNPQITYPQLGEAAHKEGKYVAKHIIAVLKGQTMRPFSFASKVMLMPVGQWYGVAIFSPRIILFGKFAWWLRRTVYVLFLPGFLRKLRLVADWTIASFGFRHIIDLNIEEEHQIK